MDTPQIPDSVESTNSHTNTDSQRDNYADDRPEKRKRKILFCFSCNRLENHSFAHLNRWFHSYLLGLTFGSIMLVGPYRCQCCGTKRLMSSNGSNPRYWFLATRDGKSTSTSSRKR